MGHQTELPPRHHEVFPGCTTKLNEDAQGKHIPGHKNYQKGKSFLSISMKRAQQLIDKYGGSGRKISGQTREFVDFHETIGVYIAKGGEEGPFTQYGVVHYGKRGCHIVPARPKQN